MLNTVFIGGTLKIFRYYDQIEHYMFVKMCSDELKGGLENGWMGEFCSHNTTQV